jgi:hypothetical protein
MKGEYAEAIRHCDRALALGFEVHPEFISLLEPHRGKRKKKTAAAPDPKKKTRRIVEKYRHQ